MNNKIITHRSTLHPKDFGVATMGGLFEDGIDEELINARVEQTLLLTIIKTKHNEKQKKLPNNNTKGLHINSKQA